ncbi:DUF5689 domain-containing protein [Pedobacter glucosidilyticus]|uniref:DUF5689 domain-containing protein n=1 Tax=Pedobacter glucosidilyticus TaxID=1122941 RepID=UPI0032E47433
MKMKRNIFLSLCILSLSVIWVGCEKSNYPGGVISPYIPIFDLRSLYKGTDLNLTVDNMFGSSKISAVVVSDHSGNNLPEGLLIVQDKKRLNELRGISIPIGPEAANYVPGDSVVVEIAGGVLKRVDGLLQITGVDASKVTKVASGKNIPVNRVGSNLILANPDKYESTLVVIVKAGFDPIPAPTEVYAGDKVINDGFENLTLHTASDATFANNSGLLFLANYYGIIISKQNTEGNLIPELRVRTLNDIIPLSSSPEIADVIISGFINDVIGGDGNYEYVQLLATKDIDFSVTPYSVVFSNNAGTSQPTGFPTNGWATGGGATSFRTYKFNLTSGTAAKGTYFYVGGSTKLINGASSTSISTANWIRSFNYTTTNGDGFGTRTSGLMANSGNAFGIAVFKGTNVTKDTQPTDVIFVGAGGSLLSSTNPPVGYRIANTDYYDVVNPITLESQPFYRQGSNTLNLNYTTPTDAGFFYKLGGIYNPTLGRWVRARTQTTIILTKTSTLEEIEGIFPAPTTDNPDGVQPTTLR